MDLRLERDELQQALYLTQGVVEKRNTLPILANVLIESTGEEVVLTATDLEVGVRQTCKGKVTRPGSITVSARKLYEIVREFPASELTIRSGDGGWVEVSGGKARYRMVSIPQHPGEPGGSQEGRRRDDAAER
jgi:DNA polymerase-3 subunit beta